MDRWNGSVALVTGASYGIGSAIALSLVKHGVQVIGCGRNVQRIQALAEQAKKENFPGTLFPIKCDLTVESDISNMFDEIRKKYGKIDICINNAGLNKMGSLSNITTENMMNIFKVNVLALCICTRESLKIMKENGNNQGHIINISSFVGVNPIPIENASFYTGTKFMVNGLTECLRGELRRENSKIKVCSLCPGAVKTNIVNVMTDGDVEMENKFLHSYKVLDPEDVADVVISVLSMPPHVDINQVLFRSNEEIY